MDLRRTLFENWAIKLLSLGLTLTLWLYVTSKGKTEMTVTIPLELRNVPQNMAVVGDVPASLEARVQGQERALRDIANGNKLAGVLNLSMAKAGDNTVSVSPDDIMRPPGVSITYLSLSEVKVRLEPLVRRTFRLRPVLHGAPAGGYRLAKVSVFPARISVEGPASVVDTLPGLQTMPIDIQGASGSMTVEPKVDYRGRALKILDTTLAVRISIEKVNR
jgi:YbbR domain-containing protein